MALIRALIHDLLAELRQNKRAEVVKTLCDRLPLLTICRLMGIDDRDAPQIKRWSTDFIRLQIPGSSVEEQRAIGQSVLDYYMFMRRLVERYTAEAADNLVRGVIIARQSDPEPLDEDRRVAHYRELRSGRIPSRQLSVGGQEAEPAAGVDRARLEVATRMHDDRAS